MKIRSFIIVALLTIAVPLCVIADITQDFETWPDTWGEDSSQDSWGITNGGSYLVAAGRRSAVLVDTGVDSFIDSPFLPNGIGTVTIEYNNLSAGNFVFELQSSPDGSTWTPIERLTNSAINPVWVPNTITADILEPSYLRIARVNPATPFLYMHVDYITVTEDPTTVTFSNSLINPATPVINSPVDVYIDAVAESGGSNLVMRLYYSTNDGLSYASTVMNKSVDTYDAQVPAQSGIGSIVQYYYEATFDFKGYLNAKKYYPSDGSNLPLSYVNAPIIGNDRDQDFEAGNWPSGWTTVNSATYFEAAPAINSTVIFLSNTNWGDYSVTSPQLLNGIGTIHFKMTPTFFSGIFYLDVQTSTDGSSWTNVTTVSASGVNTWTTNIIEVNDYRDLYVRFQNTEESIDYALIDDVYISYPPSDAMVTNVQHTKGYKYTTNEVTVTCDVVSTTPNMPSGNFLPKVCYRLGSFNTWLTNSMIPTGGGSFTYTIPPQDRGKVEYYVRCDFDGYSTVHWGVDDSQSPTFSPDAEETEYEPATNYFYDSRAYRSHYSHLNITSHLGHVSQMRLIDDYTWEGVIDFTLSPQSSLTFAFEGYNQFTNGSSDYSSLTNHWGDNSQSSSVTPITDVGGPDQAPISILTWLDGPLTFRFNTETYEYVVLKSMFQDFNNWSASSINFERSIEGVILDSITNTLDSFAESEEYFSTPMAGDGTSFDSNIWVVSSSFVTDPTQAVSWYYDDAQVVYEAGNAGPYYSTLSDKALMLDHVNHGAVWNHRSWLLDGLHTYNFNYRWSSDELYLSKYIHGALWNNYEVSFHIKCLNVRRRNPLLAPDSGVSFYVWYHDENNYYEILWRRRTNNNQDWRHSMTIRKRQGGILYTLRHQDNVWGDLWQQRIVRVRTCTNNNDRVDFEVEFQTDNLSNRGTYRNYKDDTGKDGQSLAPNTFGIKPYNLDLVITNIYAKEILFNNFDDRIDNGSTTNHWVWNNMTHGVHDPDFQWGETAWLRTPFLTFAPDQLVYNLDTLDGSNHSIRVSGSADNVSWTTLAVHSNNFATWTTFSISNTISSYRYFKWQNAASYGRSQINNVYIRPATNILEPVLFTSPSDADDFSYDALNSTWYIENNKYRRDAFAGQPVGIAVDIAYTNNLVGNDASAAQWITVYTNTISNALYQTASVNFETNVLPFRPHAEHMFVRIRHTSGDNYVVLDQISSSDWRGDTVNVGNWIGSDIWTVDQGDGDMEIQLWATRSSTNAAQYIKSPVMLTGLAGISFEYKVSGLSSNAEFEIQTATQASSNTWTVIDKLEVSDTDWTPYSSPGINDTNKVYFRIVHTSTNHPRAVLHLDNISATDFKSLDNSMWIGYNTLITAANDSREFEPSKEPASQYKTAFLNNNAYDGTGGSLYWDDMPYIQTPIMTNGIGQVSFWARSWEEDGSPQGTIYLRVSNSRTNPPSEWLTLAPPIILTNNTYQFIATNLYIKTNYFLRLTCDTNSATAKRIGIDNLLITEPMGANLEILRFGTIPEAPVHTSPTRIWAEVGNMALFPSNIIGRVAFHVGSDNWGSWTPDGIGLMTNSTGNVYVTVAQIPPQPIDEVVQYSIYFEFDGEFSSSPKYSSEFKNPDWYWPVDLNKQNYPGFNPYYYSFSCNPGDVFINEFNIVDDDWLVEPTTQYVEIAGVENAVISNWYIEVLEDNFDTQQVNIISTDGVFQDETNGWGFWVLGDTNMGIPPKNATLAASLPTDNGGIRLVRSMGAYAHALSYDVGSSELGKNMTNDTNHRFQYGGVESLSDAGANRLTGTGSNLTDFTTWVSGGEVYSPGEANTPQTFYLYTPPADLTVTINLWDIWRANNNIYIAFDIEGTNYQNPAPYYTVEPPTTTSTWTKVGSFSSMDNGSGTYTQWLATPPVGQTYYYTIQATNSY